MVPSRCYIQYVSKSGRPSSGHRTGKGQSSLQFPRREVLKNMITIRQLHSSPMLIRSCLKSCTIDFSIRRTKNFQMSRLGLEKEEDIEIKLPTFAGLQRKLGDFRKTSISVSSTTLKLLTSWIMTNYGKLLEKRKTRPPYLSPEKLVSQATVRTPYRTTAWLKIEKGVQKGSLLSPCLFNLHTKHIMRIAGLS